MTEPNWAEAYLATIAELPDDRIDLADTALALAALDRPVDPGPYRRHLAELAASFGDALAETDGSFAAGIERLQRLLAEQHGYQGDRATYDDLDNANLMRVIDRRRGLPVALGILYLHTARSAGWRAAGLAFPGHFLIRVEHEGEMAILDPFAEGRRLSTSDLRALLKSMEGASAELRPDQYSAVGNRAVLLRLQNNIKTRLVQAGEPTHAAEIARRMTLIAPKQADLWLELATLYADCGQLTGAVAAAERHVRLAPPAHRDTADALLREFKQRLN